MPTPPTDPTLPAVSAVAAVPTAPVVSGLRVRVVYALCVLCAVSALGCGEDGGAEDGGVTVNVTDTPESDGGSSGGDDGPPDRPDCDAEGGCIEDQDTSPSDTLPPDGDATPTVQPSSFIHGGFCGGWQQMQAGNYLHLSLSGAALLSSGISEGGDTASAWRLISGPSPLTMKSPRGEAPRCGDGYQDAGEVCDGDDIGGFACENLGFAAGSLACDLNSQCQAFDTAGCLTAQAICDRGDLAPSKGVVCQPDSVNVDERMVLCDVLGFDNTNYAICGDDCQWMTDLCVLPSLGEVRANGDRACAVTMNGETVCWGDNRADQSGPTNGSGAAHPPLTDAAPGGTFTCGTRAADATPYCWGDDPPECIPPDCTPTQPLNGLRVTRDAYCGLFNGEPRCAVALGGAPTPSDGWSRPAYTGPTFGVALSPTYVCLLGDLFGQGLASCMYREAGTPRAGSSGGMLAISLNGALDVAAGDNSMCAMGGGIIHCATLSPLATSLQFTTLAPITSYNFTALAMEGDIVCAHSTGTFNGVFCWDARSPTPSPLLLPMDLGGATVQGLAMGRDFVCVQTPGGPICAKRFIPGPIMQYSGGAVAPDVQSWQVPALSATASAGGGTGCALRYDPVGDRDGLQVQPTCWGPTADRFPFEISAWRALAVGGAQDLCVVNSDGILTCALTGDTSHWTRDDWALAQVTVGQGVGCGVDTDGVAHCWGSLAGGLPAGFQEPPADARFAKLALVSDGNSNAWCGVTEGSAVTGVGPLRCSDDLVTRYGVGAPGSSSYVRDVALSPGYLCYVGAAGWINCFGDGKPAELPPNDNALSGFRKVAVSPAFACGLRFDGGLACWGDVPQSLTDAQRASLDIVDISGGALGVCALRRGGDFACWGDVALGYR